MTVPRTALLSVALVGVVFVALFAGTNPTVVAREVGGSVVVRAGLPESGAFAVEYVHSYYGVPAEERFVAGGGDGFELVEVASESEAVLDYYAIEGRKGRENGLFTLSLAEPMRLDELPLIATQKGRRTLVVDGERYPLYRDGDPLHLELRVEH